MAQNTTVAPHAPEGTASGAGRRAIFMFGKGSDVGRSANAYTGDRYSKTLMSYLPREQKVELEYESANGEMLEIQEILSDHGMGANEIEESIDRNQMLSEAYRRVNRLDKRKQQILRMRFWDEMTLEEIGTAMGLSRERIRQLEREAKAELRCR